MRNKITLFICLVLPLAFMSCVHEWPEPPAVRNARLTVTFDNVDGENTGWGIIHHNVQDGRTRAGEETLARYTYEVYPAGNTRDRILRDAFVSQDLSCSDFTVGITLPEGEYDIYMWRDHVDSDVNEIFYKAADFSGITYTGTHIGNDSRKDCFSGKLSVSVPRSINGDINVTGTIHLSRPLTAYTFIATDLRDFIESEISRRNLPHAAPPDPAAAFDIKAYIPDFDKYTVRFKYTGFLPSVFNIFHNKPTDSSTGVSFTAPVSVLNSSEVLFGYDYFFCNGPESGIRVALDVHDPQGNIIASTPNFDIPVKMSCCTVVRGDFLTSKASGGVGIDPGFDGEFNIEITR